MTIYDAQQWGKLISYAKKHGTLSISILGGESALYFDIDALLTKCDQLKINTVMTTNCLCLKKARNKYY